MPQGSLSRDHLGDLSVALELTQRMWAAAQSENWTVLDALHVEQAVALQAYFSVERSALELVQIQSDLEIIKRLHDDTIEVAAAHRQQSIEESITMNRGRRASQAYSAIEDNQHL